MKKSRSTQTLLKSLGESYWFPEDFDEKDEELLKTFCERLKGLRKKYMNDPKNKYVFEEYRDKECWSMEAVAKRLGISTPSYWRYENYRQKDSSNKTRGLAKIPLSRLREIAYYFNTTPHYLLGYTEKQDESYFKNADGDIDLKDGDKVQLIEPMTFMDGIRGEAIKDYEELEQENPRLFNMIHRLILSNEKVHEIFLSLFDITNFK